MFQPYTALRYGVKCEQRLIFIRSSLLVKTNRATKNRNIKFGFIWKLSNDIIDGEIWKEFVYEGIKLKASSVGRVELPSGYVTYGYKEPAGYLGVNTGGFKMKVHRLVCIAFRPRNDADKYVVNHIDNVKHNNKLENLEWVTVKENNIHAQDFRIEHPTKTGKPVRQFDINGKFIADHESITKASLKTGICAPSISCCCAGKYTNAGGFLWEYITIQ